MLVKTTYTTKNTVSKVRKIIPEKLLIYLPFVI